MAAKRKKLSICVPSAERVTTVGGLSSPFHAKCLTKINLDNIDLIVLDWDNTVMSQMFLRISWDDEKYKKFVRLNAFFTNLLRLGKYVCVCTSASNAGSFAEFCAAYDENLLKPYRDDMDIEELGSCVPIFTSWSFDKISIDHRSLEYDNCAIAGGHSSKNDRLNSIIGRYTPLISTVEPGIVDYTIPSRVLFIDDQEGILCNAQQALGCKVVLANTYIKEDIVNLFEKLVPKDAEYRETIFEGTDV